MAGPTSAWDAFLYQFGPEQRRTQDSPVLPNVWRAFWEKPGKPVDLLLTPHRDTRPAELAAGIRAMLFDKVEDEISDVAHNQSTVAVSVTFDHMVSRLVPLSGWWQESIQPHATEARKYAGYTTRSKKLRALLDILEKPATTASALPLHVVWWLRLIGNLSLHTDAPETQPEAVSMVKRGLTLMPPAARAVPEARLFRISVNRTVQPSCLESIRTVKADAAGRVFEIDTRRICWAVLDSGVDARHPAFKDGAGDSRVRSTYDFTRVRRLLTLASTPGDAAESQLRDEFDMSGESARQVRASLASGGDVDWEILKPALVVRHSTQELKDYAGRISSHGTHVAGILGGAPAEVEDEGRFSGMCPEIRIVDVRILDRDEKPGEFDIIAALQFIRHLNASSDDPVVHGVNLSIQLQHDPRDFACGRTPVCEECNRLVASGVVVVAAAGNLGIESGTADAPTTEGSFRDISIADPGNAEAVLTVGSTHRKRPHAYGISYFSSRGPTGDGRQKPDLVAPGEKILGPIVDSGYRRMEGTSMAAPHVSGAAALLMARYSELIGEPARVKRILCDTATDLGRQREFQGAGLVDILRALQSI